VAPNARGATVPRVVVLGAGFGGLAVVRGLRRVPVDVLLIDQHNYHLFTPLLYEVASALLNPSEIAHPVRAILRRTPNAEFRLGQVTGVDLAGKAVVVGATRIPFDYLVLAAGSVNNYFDGVSLAERSLALKDLEAALALRNHLLLQFERASATSDPEERKRLLTFAVAGAGPTGIEFAGALSELIGLVLSRDFPRLDLSSVEILLIEASDRILSAFAPGLQRAAMRRIERKGIRILLNAPVRDVGDGVLRLQDGRVIATETVIWTAGVRAAPLAGTLGAPLGRAGRVVVEPTLQVRGHPDAYAIGDVAEIDGYALPLLAPVAIQQGRWAAHNIARQVHGAAAMPFRYRDKGIMATIGRNAAVVQIGPIRVEGFAGWMIWLFVHLLMIVSFRSRLVVLLNWAWDYFLYDRPIRLISRQPR
jgi:NADH dehydrogenase